MSIDLDALQTRLGSHAVPARSASTGEAGVSLPPFHDHHVHLHLIDSSGLAARGIAAVVDLGGDPVALARIDGGGFPRVSFAGAFLTAAGGYPIGRPWAPDRISHVVTDASTHPGVAGGARTAVDAQADAGASVVKMSLNAAAGPIPERAVLEAIVAAAGQRRLPVVAHCQGVGMAALALEIGVDVVAHTPFDERLDADAITDAATSGQAWISTLGIHSPSSREIAVANLAAFAAAGGRVLYGTDLGNGDQPVGVNAEELRLMLAAGLDPAAVVAAITDPWPVAEAPSGVCTFVPGVAPSDDADLPAWLAGARVVPSEELIHDAR